MKNPNQTEVSKDEKKPTPKKDTRTVVIMEDDEGKENEKNE